MRYAIVEEGKVVNTLIAEQDFIDAHYPSAIAVDDSVNVGWLYEAGEFVKPADILIEPNPNTPNKPYPVDGFQYTWDSEVKDWVKVN